MKISVFVAIVSVGCATGAPPRRPLPWMERSALRETPISSGDDCGGGRFVLTQHNDRCRTGANIRETALSPETVKADRFGLLYSLPVDGQIYAQPLYVPGVQLEGEGRTRDVVYVATMHNTVYAFDAAQPGPPIWTAHLGDPVDFDFFPMKYWFTGKYNIYPEIGITSTPVVDAQTQTLYTVAKVKTGGCFLHWFEKVKYQLFALDLVTGKQRKNSPVDIEAQVPGLGTGTRGGKVAFNPVRQLQRAALLLAHGQLYVGFGGHQDTSPYHGWLFAYDPATLARKAAYCTTCKGRHADEGGIWQAGTGPAADNESVYVMTGNGTFHPPASSAGLDGLQAGSTVLRLGPDLSPKDFFTPGHYACLNYVDADLGSAGPLLMPGGLLLGGGKEGVFYVIDRARMGGLQGLTAERAAAPCENYSKPALKDPPLQSFQATPLWSDPRNDHGFMGHIQGLFPDFLSWGYHHIHGSPVYWETADGPLIYVWAERDVMRAYRFDRGSRSFAGTVEPGMPPVSTYVSERAAGQGMPGAALTLTSNGADPKSALVWASLPLDQDALTDVVEGVLRVFEAVPSQPGSNVLQELWNSKDDATAPSHAFAKYTPPTVVNGRVYLATFSHRLDVYGPRPPGAHNVPVAAGAEQRYVLTAREEQPGDAAFVEQTAPQGKLTPGATMKVSVTMRNDGATRWESAQGFSLASDEPPFNLGWRRSPTVDLPHSVAPSASVTFAFEIRVPREGKHHYRFRMSRAGHLFGTPTPDLVFSVPNPGCDDLRDKLETLRQTLIKAPEQDAASHATAITELREKLDEASCSVPGDETAFHQTAEPPGAE